MRSRHANSDRTHVDGRGYELQKQMPCQQTAQTNNTCAARMARHVHGAPREYDISEDIPLRKPRKQSALAVGTVIVAISALSGCNMKTGHHHNVPAEQDTVKIESALNAADAATQRHVIPTITGIGYATISAQPARNVNQKRLMAIRAARLEAMRDITEQVHGLRLNSQTTMIDAIIQNDTTRASVAGTIRGARTARINPVGRDTYEVALELDRDMIARIIAAAR